MDHAVVACHGHGHAGGIELATERFTFVTQNIQFRCLD